MDASADDAEMCERTKNVIAAHAGELAVRRRKLTGTPSYGVVDQARWNEEVQNFIVQCIEGAGLTLDYSRPRLEAVRRMIDAVTADYETPRPCFSNDMDPGAYEQMVADALTGLGWQTHVKGGSGDQGVDVVATLRGLRAVIQCKRYASTVGNAAVQEIFAGRAFEGADFAVVVSGAGFTRGALELAKRTGVILLHHDEISQLESQIFGTTSTQSDSVQRQNATRSATARIAAVLRITPYNYEQFVADGLTALGWQTRLSNEEENRYVDVIAEQDGRRAKIMCAGFFTVSEFYVQQLLTVRSTNGADFLAIVSDQDVTNGALDLAAVAEVLVISHHDLTKLATHVFGSLPSVHTSLDVVEGAARLRLAFASKGK